MSINLKNIHNMASMFNSYLIKCGLPNRTIDYNDNSFTAWHSWVNDIDEAKALDTYFINLNKLQSLYPDISFNLSGSHFSFSEDSINDINADIVDLPFEIEYSTNDIIPIKTNGAYDAMLFLEMYRSKYNIPDEFQFFNHYDRYLIFGTDYTDPDKYILIKSGEHCKMNVIAEFVKKLSNK